MISSTRARGIADRKSGSAGMPRPISYAVFCLKKISLIGSFGAVYLLGSSLNNRSLMALTIATGFVVDDVFFKDTATTEIYTLSLHDALPISPRRLDVSLNPRSLSVSNWETPMGAVSQ